MTPHLQAQPLRRLDPLQLYPDGCCEIDNRRPDGLQILNREYIQGKIERVRCHTIDIAQCLCQSSQHDAECGNNVGLHFVAYNFCATDELENILCCHFNAMLNDEKKVWDSPLL